MKRQRYLDAQWKMFIINAPKRSRLLKKTKRKVNWMKLSNKELKDWIIKAQAGDNKAMTDILELYMPLINKHSFVNGKLDEDLRQNILLEIVKSIKKFVP